MSHLLRGISSCFACLAADFVFIFGHSKFLSQIDAPVEWLTEFQNRANQLSLRWRLSWNEVSFRKTVEHAHFDVNVFRCEHPTLYALLKCHCLLRADLGVLSDRKVSVHWSACNPCEHTIVAVVHSVSPYNSDHRRIGEAKNPGPEGEDHMEITIGI